MTPIPTTARQRFFIILMLGALNTVTPFSIDMYLPAFQEIARDLGTTPAMISLSVSGYFIGLALGQLFYGPLLDRFGRKPPLYAGLSIFILASIGCMLVRDPDWFIAFRVMQALGGCVAQVAAMAMVRDFFPAEDCARIISLLILILSVSPLFAPSIGSLIATYAGWPWIFAVLAGFAMLNMGLVAFCLPEGHKADPGISLKPHHIMREFLAILKNRTFRTYALAGAFSFAGLFVYVAGSPIIFIDGFHMSGRAYSLMFAVLACGFIGGSQVNVWLTRKHRDRKIFNIAVICQNVIALVIISGVAAHLYGLTATFALLLIYLPFCGIAYPNAAAIALSPFSKNVGSASALLGFIQMGTGALASTGVGVLKATGSLPVFGVMAGTAFVGLLILRAGMRREHGL